MCSRDNKLAYWAPQVEVVLQQLLSVESCRMNGLGFSLEISVCPQLYHKIYFKKKHFQHLYRRRML